jgi:diguanylate cyclase (GGDEF)-like protein
LASTGDDFFAGLDEARAAGSDPAGADRNAGAWRLITEITDLLNSPIDRFDSVLEAVLETTIRLTRADRGLLMLRDESGALAVKLARNLALDTLPAEERRVSHSIVDQVVKSGQGVCIPDLGDEEAFAPSASITELKLLSVMCVPLVQKIGQHARAPEGAERRSHPAPAGQRVIGAIYVDSRSVTTSFHTRDLALFQALANVATSAILHAETFREATTDRLSGLATRSQLERRLRVEIGMAKASRGGLSALLIDIDHLGETNTTRGFAAGDRLIQVVARVLRSRTRQLDTCGRYGGEEFLVLLPGTDSDGSEEVARKLLIAMHREGVNVSIGVATWGGDPTESSAGFVRRCDQALTHAKAEGGGRARPWTPALAHTEPIADRLAGIFSGDAAAVYRNVLVLLESIPKIHGQSSVKGVHEGALESVIDLARAERGLLFTRIKGGVRPEIGFDWRRRATDLERFDLELIERVTQTGEAEANAARGGSDGQPAVLCAPIQLGGGAATGAIYLEARDEAFREGALAFVVEFARQAAIAIENARLLEENREYGRKIEKLMRGLEEEQERKVKELELELESRRASDTVAPAPAVPRESPPRPHDPSQPFEKIVGDSAAMQKVYHLIQRVIGSSAAVFVHGESGTGKELVAKAIHFSGPRKRGRFVAENCAAMTETLLESELFGYVRGAFTGAHTDRPGLFEVASGGTLFLDEVGDMTSSMQTKLLRVLQEGEVRRVGGKDVIQVDVRMISASNKDIQRMVEAGSFREDLYYRLNVVRIDLPPLRDRDDDVRMLVDHFLRDAGQLVKARKGISDAALELLVRYPFPGNVRELRNVIERAKILAEGDLIGTEAIVLDSDWRELGSGGPAPSFGLHGPGASGPKASGPWGARRDDVLHDLRSARPAPPSLGAPPGSQLEALYFQLNDRQRKLIEYLTTYGSIKNRDYYEIMGVSKSTGWRDLKDLMAKDLIQVAGRGKGSVYSLTQEATAPPPEEEV